MASTSRPTEEFSMAFVTAPNHEKAKEIASGLVRYNSQLNKYAKHENSIYKGSNVKNCVFWAG